MITLLLWPLFFFFNDTATTEIYTLSLHDALPILPRSTSCAPTGLMSTPSFSASARNAGSRCAARKADISPRSEEHTSELQSHLNLVCRLLLEKKNNNELLTDTIGQL